MLPCLGVLSPPARTLSNRVSCDSNQRRERFPISFHLHGSLSLSYMLFGGITSRRGGSVSVPVRHE